MNDKNWTVTNKYSIVVAPFGLIQHVWCLYLTKRTKVLKALVNCVVVAPVLWERCAATLYVSLHVRQKLFNYALPLDRKQVERNEEGLPIHLHAQLLSLFQKVRPFTHVIRELQRLKRAFFSECGDLWLLIIILLICTDIYKPISNLNSDHPLTHK